MIKKCICRELNLSNSTEFYGHFVFTSLEVGEGITLGNMLRRTLLSSLNGSKIVGIRILNVNHEFSEIHGVREDMLEIILNLKEVIIKNSPGYPSCYGRIKLNGPCIVTAGSFIFPEGIKVINPNHYLFTVVEKITIDIEVKIELGKSYVLATDRKLDELGAFFPIDANFTPIVNVDYYIQSILEFVEHSQEELHIIIYTDGTLLPQEALLLATNNLSRLILGCRNIESSNFAKKITDSIVSSNVQNQFLTTFETRENRKQKSKDNLLRENKINQINSSQLNSLSPPRFKNFHSFPQLGKKKFKKVTNVRKQDENKNLNRDNPIKEQETTKVKVNGPTIQSKSKSDIIYTSTKTLDLKTVDIEITCLPNRIIAILRKSNINVMSELLKYSLLDLQKIKGLGPVSVKKIKTQVDLFFEAISL